MMTMHCVPLRMCMFPEIVRLDGDDNRDTLVIGVPVSTLMQLRRSCTLDDFRRTC